MLEIEYTKYWIDTAESICKALFPFPKALLHNASLPWAFHGSQWDTLGTGGKSCDGVSPLVKDMMLAGQSHSSSSKVQQRPEQGSGRLSYMPQNGQLHIQPKKEKTQMRGDEQSLVEASVTYSSNFFYAMALPLLHVEVNTLKISAGIN